VEVTHRNGPLKLYNYSFIVLGSLTRQTETDEGKQYFPELLISYISPLSVLERAKFASSCDDYTPRDADFLSLFKSHEC
jgi:hypothetical protein